MKRHSLTALILRLPWLANLDIHIKEVLRGASLAFALKVTAAGLTFGFNVLLARRIGVEGAGIFYLAFTIAFIATVIGRMGLDNALLRFVATNAAEGRWDKVFGVYRKGILISTLASTIAMLVIASSAHWAAGELFSKPALAQPLRLMAFSILPLSLLTLYGQLLIGLKKISNALLVQNIGVPLISILLLLLLGSNPNINNVAIAYVASTVAVMLLGIRLWSRAVPKPADARNNFNTRTLLLTRTPLFLVDSMNLIMGWTGIFVLGIWASSESVGIFSIAVRTASVTSFILISANSVVAPKFAEFYAQENYTALGNLARTTAKLLSLFAAPILLVFLLFPKWVLGLFGDDFSEGALALMILAVGQFVNVAAGSVGYLLIMGGQEKLLRNIIVISALINISLNLALVPSFGIVGAALATAVSVALVNILAVLLAYRKFSIITIPIPTTVRTAFSREK